VLHYFSVALQCDASVVGDVGGKKATMETRTGYAVAAAASVLSGAVPSFSHSASASAPFSRVSTSTSSALDFSEQQPVSERDLALWALLERAVLHARYLSQARSTAQGEAAAAAAATETGTATGTGKSSLAPVSALTRPFLCTVDDLCFDLLSARAFSRALQAQEIARQL